MTLLEHIDSARSQLTQSDRALLDEILSYPADAPLWRGKEIADRVGIHPSTATRTAQRLGYRGYRELAEALRNELNTRLTGAGDRFRTELQEHNTGTVLDNLVQTEMDSLTVLSRHISQAQLDSVADAIVAARKVFLFARGNSSILAEMSERRLRRFGFDTINLRGAGREIAERILLMNSEDLVVTFAFRKPPRHVDHVLGHAKRTQAQSVLITDTLHTLNPAPDTVLSALRGHQEGFASLTVPMLIINAIVLTIAKRYPTSTLPNLDRLDELLADFE